MIAFNNDTGTEDRTMLNNTDYATEKDEKTYLVAPVKWSFMIKFRKKVRIS